MSWRRLTKGILVVLIVLGAAGYFSFQWLLSNEYVVPILMYHSIEYNPAPGNRLAVDPRILDKQLRFLKEHRYNVIPLESLAALVRDKKPIPPKTIAITFDDGYKNNYTNAFPILKKYKIPATIFLIVNEVGRSQGDRLKWEDVGEMQQSGLITFGSHSLDPEPLVNLKSEEELRKQIFFSKEVLEKRLGRPVNSFSYTSGLFTSHIRQLVIDAGYQVAVTTNPGNDYPDYDVYALKRQRISSTADNPLVFWLQTSGIYTFIKEHRKK